MNPDSSIPEEIKALIGTERVYTGKERLGKGTIKRFADAIGDRNPLYWDDDYARNSRYGGVVAPPGFFGWPTRWKGATPTVSILREEMMKTITQEGYGRLLDGGIEYDFIRPVRAGDTLAVLPRIKDIYERESKSGTMILSIIETTYTNQNGDLVARARSTMIHR